MVYKFGKEFIKEFIKCAKIIAFSANASFILTGAAFVQQYVLLNRQRITEKINSDIVEQNTENYLCTKDVEQANLNKKEFKNIPPTNKDDIRKLKNIPEESEKKPAYYVHEEDGVYHIIGNSHSVYQGRVKANGAHDIRKKPLYNTD